MFSSESSDNSVWEGKFGMLAKVWLYVDLNIYFMRPFTLSCETKMYNLTREKFVNKGRASKKLDFLVDMSTIRRGGGVDPPPPKNIPRSTTRLFYQNCSFQSIPV